jgi:hypothetical protein
MRPIKIIVAVLLLLGALVWVWRGLHPPPPNDVTMPYIGLGQVLAKEAANQLHGKEGRVVVVCMPTASVGSQAQLGGLQRALGQYRNITVTMDAFKTDQVGAMDTISFQQFEELVSENANADVIISFLKVAPFSDAQITQLPHPCPKLIVVRWGHEAVQRGMSASLVVAAVMERRWNSSPSQPKTPRQWFDGRYQLITPQSNTPPQ